MFDTEKILIQMRGVVSLLYDVDFDRITPDEYHGALMTITENLEKLDSALHGKDVGEKPQNGAVVVRDTPIQA